uniref:Methyltransf_11 domain-containing protein n=1 Tax=Macrostomum lignano TaxID=282301 RepID=A0A1I8JQM9_9PLAT
LMRSAVRRLCSQAAAAAAAASSSASTSATSAAEAQKFASLADSWWDRAGPAAGAALAEPAPLRPRPAGLADAELVDLGCGGGLLAEPLARLGVRVLGVDPVAESVEAASSRRQQSAAAESGIADGRLTFRCQTVSELAADRPAEFDLAVASEVLEHVDNWPEFLRSAADLLRPGGCLVVTTINRTAPPTGSAWWLLRRLLRLVPRDSRLAALRRCLADCGLETRLTVGMRLNPLTGRWAWSRDLSLSYGLLMRSAVRRLCSQAAAAAAASSSASTSATSAAEAQKFASLADSWWDRAGPLQALHSLNRLRVPLVRTAASFRRGPGGLADAELVDLGCGGGLLAEPLARLRRARSSTRRRQQSAAAESGIADGRLTFRCQTVSELAADRPAEFDLAVASEVLEHVDNWPEFLRSAADLLRPGGCLLSPPSTRTAASYWLARAAAPPGAARDSRLAAVHPGLISCEGAWPTAAWRPALTVGMRLNPLTGRWAWNCYRRCCAAGACLLFGIGLLLLLCLLCPRCPLRTAVRRRRQGSGS